MLARVQSHRAAHSLLLGMQNGTATLEDNLAVSYKAKTSFSIGSSKHVFRNLLNEIKIYPSAHKSHTLDWREGLMVRSTCCSCRGLVSSTHTAAHKHLYLQLQGIRYPLLAAIGTARTRYTYIQSVIHTHS